MRGGVKDSRIKKSGVQELQEFRREMGRTSASSVEPLRPSRGWRVVLP